MSHQRLGSRPPLPPLPAGYQDIARRPSPTPGYTPPGPRSLPQQPSPIVSPRPQLPPTSIPAGQLEREASEIGFGQRSSPVPGAFSPRQDSYSLPSGSPNTHQQSFGPAPPIPARPSQLRPAPVTVSPPTPEAAPSFPTPEYSTQGMRASGQYRATSVSQPSLSQLSTGTASMTIDAGARRAANAPVPTSTSGSSPSHSASSFSPARRTSPAADGTVLSIVMPSLDDLAIQRQQAGSDPTAQVRWARDLLRYIERTTIGSSITDQRLIKWIDDSIKIILRAAQSMPPVPEALYLRADLAMSGSFPSLIPKNPKVAFRDFEAAANAEYGAAWYRIGREYESFSDSPRAMNAYQSGLRLGDVTCTYRLAMCYLLGQLDQQRDTRRALELLKKAAIIADQIGDAETAAPLYVHGLVLAGEFEAPGVDTAALPRDANEAGRWISKAAYLGHAAAQHKMGQACEFAQLGEPFDPLLSVQYYSLASQQGDPESDLALSRWFLCGADGYFETNESLAYTFAEKAASKNLAAGAFAVAYYHETGIGCEKNVETAKKWYRRAVSQGNADARGRLEALEKSASASMSRAQHEHEVNERLVRRRTQARIQSENMATRRPQQSRVSSAPALPIPGQAGSDRTPAKPTDINRRNTIRMAEQASKSNRRGESSGSPASPRPPAQQSASDGRQRYSLTDRPASAASAPAPHHSSSLPPTSRPSAPPAPYGPSSSSSVPPSIAPPKKGPSTFAEMGVPEAKMRKEECIVM